MKKVEINSFVITNDNRDSMMIANKCNHKQITFKDYTLINSKTK